jgi:hypothetical protein
MTNSITEIEKLRDKIHKIAQEIVRDFLKPKFKVGDKVIVNGATQSGTVIYVTPSLNGHFYCDVKYANDGVNTFDESVLNFAVKAKFEVGDRVIVNNAGKTKSGDVFNVGFFKGNPSYTVKYDDGQGGYLLSESQLRPAPEEVKPKFKVGDLVDYANGGKKVLVATVKDYHRISTGYLYQIVDNYIIYSMVEEADLKLHSVGFGLVGDNVIKHVTSVIESGGFKRGVIDLFLEASKEKSQPKFKVGDYVERNNGMSGYPVEIKEIIRCVNGTIFYRVVEKPSSDGYYMSEKQLTGEEKSSTVFPAEKHIDNLCKPSDKWPKGPGKL